MATNGAVEGEHAGLEHLPEGECWSRLRGTSICRLAFSLDGRIEIIPANFMSVKRRLLFRTVPGSAIARAAGSPAAFEVDGWTEREAWSVVVRGPLERVDDPADLRLVEEFGAEPWPSRDEPPTVVAELLPIELRGVRFERRPHPEPVWYW
jgi:nitroimidazol reductase NimA-like FMN-containing flavoprotein (pyridoxamine 5'-phosphate oxidase superfamily)